MKILKIKVAALLVASVTTFSLFAGNGIPELATSVPSISYENFDEIALIYESTNASAAEFISLKSKIEAISSDNEDCFMEAWDYGTQFVTGITFESEEDKEFWEWKATDWYYSKYCE